MVVAPGAVRAPPPTAMDGQNYPPTNTTPPETTLPTTSNTTNTVQCRQNDSKNPQKYSADIAVLCVPRTPDCSGKPVGWVGPPERPPNRPLRSELINVSHAV